MLQMNVKIYLTKVSEAEREIQKLETKKNETEEILFLLHVQQTINRKKVSFVRQPSAKEATLNVEYKRLEVRNEIANANFKWYAEHINSHRDIRDEWLNDLVELYETDAVVARLLEAKSQKEMDDIGAALVLQQMQGSPRKKQKITHATRWFL